MQCALSIHNHFFLPLCVVPQTDPLPHQHPVCNTLLFSSVFFLPFGTVLQAAPPCILYTIHSFNHFFLYLGIVLQTAAPTPSILYAIHFFNHFLLSLNIVPQTTPYSILYAIHSFNHFFPRVLCYWHALLHTVCNTFFLLNHFLPPAGHCATLIYL